MTGFLRGKTHLIHDRDPMFTARLREILKCAGVESVRLTPKSPNLNAYPDRQWVIRGKVDLESSRAEGRAVASITAVGPRVELTERT